MRFVTRPLLALTCLILVTSSEVTCDVTTPSSEQDPVTSSVDNLGTWQPLKWLSEPAGNGLKLLMVTDTNETMTKLYYNGQLTNCELRVASKNDKLEITQLKLQMLEQNKALEIHKLKMTHAEMTNKLMQEKLAALEETSRYKRQLGDFSSALVKLREEFMEKYSELKNQTFKETQNLESDVNSKEEINGREEGNFSAFMQTTARDMNLLNNWRLSTEKNFMSSLQQLKDKPEPRKSPRLINPNIELVELGGRNYHFSKDKVNWHEAQRICRSYGMDLAALETAEESKLVQTHFYKKINGGLAWVDGSDESSEGRWRWSSLGGRDVTYFDWHPRYYNRGTNYNCMLLCSSSGVKQLLCDWNCNESWHYICE